jgi:hypothetical protein
MQREKPATSAGFLAAQFHKSGSRSAAVRVGQRSTDSVEELDSQSCASYVEKSTSQIAPGSTIAITARVKVPPKKCFGRRASSFSTESTHSRQSAHRNGGRKADIAERALQAHGAPISMAALQR